jgi:predicted butyrate kinase (DUF1464 family)
LILLDDGLVTAQVRFVPKTLNEDPHVIARVLDSWSPIDLIAAPSGYGLPLVYAQDVDEEAIDLMAFVRPDERRTKVGVLGYRSCVRAFLNCGIPTVFLPGGVHLPTIPAHRKVNAIDLGTADKVAVAALAIRQDGGLSESFALVEIGTAFSAVLVVADGAIVDATAGSKGPIGLLSCGAWDGETAYGLSPLSKADLFRGGWNDLGDLARPAFIESLRKHVAGLRAITPFDRIYLSGTGLDRPGIRGATLEALDGLGEAVSLANLPGSWVKHSAQGSALLADGLAGGSNEGIVESLAIHRASGTIFDHLRIRTQPPEAPR